MFRDAGDCSFNPAIDGSHLAVDRRNVFLARLRGAVGELFSYSAKPANAASSRELALWGSCSAIQLFSCSAKPANAPSCHDPNE
jgi:hypothetical protein